jgi:Protein of unknown function (DUF3788)
MSAPAVLPPNAFIGAASAPTDPDLALALGPAKPVWDALLGSLTADAIIDTREWKSYSRKAGWAFRLARGKRTIVWLAPCDRQIRIAFILGDKAVAAARRSNLPARVIALLDDAPKYPEGTGLRLHITSAKDLPAIRKLARIKLEN